MAISGSPRTPTTRRTTSSFSRAPPASFARKRLLHAGLASITSRSITISVTRPSAAANWPGNGTLHGLPAAPSASTANMMSCGRRSPTAATCRAFLRCVSAAASTGATTTGSCAQAGCMHLRRMTFRSSTPRRRDTIWSRCRSSTGSSGRIRRGGRSRSRPGWLATICSTPTFATPSNSTRTRSCSPGGASSCFSTSNTASTGRADRPAPGSARSGRLPTASTRAPALEAAWNWAGIYAGGNVGYLRGEGVTNAAFNDAATAASLSGARLSSTARHRELWRSVRL